MKILSLLILSVIASDAVAQSKDSRPINILFIGNSYIYYNDLPKIIVDMAASTGDKITTDSSTPGGYTFKQHTTNVETTHKIKEGTWDYVVLQEQSQIPSGPIKDVEKNVFPFAYSLDSMVHKYNSKANTIFYMTWGRKNGDLQRCQAYPAVCTYKGMDSLLNARYTVMAKNNHALLSPVSMVWKYLRENNPSIELYDSDGSHPSPAGSYAAACCFYAVILKKDASLVKYDFTLSAADASAIRNAVKKVVK
jgi:hypothetical protein